MIRVFILLSVIVTLGAEPSPKYILNSAESRRIEAVLTYEIKMPKLQVREWIVYAAKAPELPGQTRVNTTMEPGGKPSFELSPERRPIIAARISGQKGREHEIIVHVKYQATLLSRELVPLRAGRKAPAVTPLSEKERQTNLEVGGDFDWKSELVQKWVREHQLLRSKSESDIDFARRAFVAVRKNFTYDYKSEMNRHASAVCKAGKSDCGGLSMLLVTILRGNDIPARILVGRWAQSSKPKDIVGDQPYYQTHVKAEFFAAGIGWVPVDVATGILDKDGGGLRGFGNDPGDFLVMHVNPNIRLDSIHFGKKDVEWLQSPAYWVTGRGGIEPSETHEKWEVRKMP
jgi:transglutaminase-like putative cysteine protease